MNNGTASWRDRDCNDMPGEFQGKPIEGAIGFAYLGLRDYDKALDCLERAVARDGLPEEFFRDPFMDEIRNLPRVQAFLQKAKTAQATF